MSDLSFSVEMDDKTSQPAKEAASSIGQLAAQIGKEESALADLQKQWDALDKAKGPKDTEMMGLIQSKIFAQNNTIGDLKNDEFGMKVQSVIEVEGSITNLGKALDVQEAKASSLRKAISDMGKAKAPPEAIRTLKEELKDLTGDISITRAAFETMGGKVGLNNELKAARAEIDELVKSATSEGYKLNFSMEGLSVEEVKAKIAEVMADDEVRNLKFEADVQALIDAKTPVDQLQASAAKYQDTLRNLEQTMANVSAATSGSVAALKPLKAEHDQVKAKLAATTGALTRQGAALKGLDSGTARKEMLGLMSVVKASSGAMGQYVGQVQGMMKALSSAGPYGAAAAGLAAVLAVVLSLEAALVVVVFKMAQFALASSNAARSQGLLLEGITKNAAQAKELQAAIDSVAMASALDTSKVSDLGTQLARAKFRGEEFRDVLEAAAMASSAGGSEAESKFLKDAIAAKKAGQSIDALVKKIKGDYGGVAAKQAMDFDVQMKKLGGSVGGIFKGVAIEPFLGALQKLTTMFDQNHASGKALKVIVTTFMDPLFAVVAALEPVISAFFKGMVLGALLVSIAILKLGIVILKALGPPAKKDVDSLGDAMKATLVVAALAGVVAVGALVITLGILTGLLVLTGVAVAYVALSLFMLMLPVLITITLAAIAFGATLLAVMIPGLILAAVVIALVVAAVYLAVKAVSWLADEFKELTGIDLKQIGSDIIDGLLNGLKEKAKEVLTFLGSLGDKMADTLRFRLDSHSPSRVFTRIGMDTAEGFEHGIVEGTDDVDTAVRGMISLPPPDLAGNSTSITNSSMTSYNRSTSQPVSVVVNITAPSNRAEDIALAVKRAIAEVFEGIAIQQGVATA